jgi:hypothetical protein
VAVLADHILHIVGQLEQSINNYGLSVRVGIYIAKHD